MDEAETDVLAYMTFPKEHWSKIHSVNPLERLNGEIKRRTNVVDIFPNEEAATRGFVLHSGRCPQLLDLVYKYINGHIVAPEPEG